MHTAAQCIRQHGIPAYSDPVLTPGGAVYSDSRSFGAQFLAEWLLLSALGGVTGVLLGAAATVGYATASGQPTVVPLSRSRPGL